MTRGTSDASAVYAMAALFFIKLSDDMQDKQSRTTPQNLNFKSIHKNTPRGGIIFIQTRRELIYSLHLLFNHRVTNDKALSSRIYFVIIVLCISLWFTHVEIDFIKSHFEKFLLLFGIIIRIYIYDVYDHTF